MAKIAVIPGDGAGIEVTHEAVKVIEHLRTRHKLSLELDHFDFGAERYLSTGV